jgi:hypothetical protein
MMRTRLQDSPSGLEIVHGQIDEDGSTINSGSADWMATKTLTGVYVIRYLKFRSPPSVQVTPVAWVVPYVVSIQSDWCQVQMALSNDEFGELVDTAFSFSIEGRVLL